MAGTQYWLDQIYTNSSRRQQAIIDERKFEGFSRQFSTSGLSQSNGSHYRMVGGGPYNYLITPYPTETLVVVRYVQLCMHETGGWNPNSFLVQLALTSGLKFSQFRQGILYRDFTSENFGRQMATNRSIAFSCDDYQFKNDQVLDAGAFARWYFDDEHGGGVMLTPGDDIRFTIQSGDTIAQSALVQASCKGFVSRL